MISNISHQKRERRIVMNRNPKGCSNIGGPAAAKLEYCRNMALKIFSAYGYRPFSPSELQLVEDVWDKLSKSRARRLIALNSPFGEPCVLRGDLTLSAVAYLSSHYEENERPLRLCYADRVFSAPVPPRGNLEENQVGIELIGWEGSGTDAEVISLLLRTLDELSIERSIVVIGDMSVVAKLFEGLPEKSAEQLVGALQEGIYTTYSRILDETETDDKRRKLLKALPSLKGDCSVISEAMLMMDDPSLLMPLKKLCDSLCKLGYSDRIRIDLGFIRDLGYYSGPIFNAYSSVTASLLGGGGRYDGLLAKVGMEGEASGFALNIKELAEHCVDGSPSPKIMLWCGCSDPAEGLRYADGLYKKGISFELSWTTDKEESMKTAGLRKYKFWADFSSKQVINIMTGQIFDLTDFDREVLSC
ncbi:MAG TPA: hypothetical protein DCL58_06760 [Synergistaceae bacterium]|jgi:ATP phosphoribosyltransferase regulatory subunit|nr:hypothetical protein [Synergistaceae bacterium]